MPKVRLMNQSDIASVSQISMQAFGKLDINNFEFVLSNKNYKYFVIENDSEIVCGYCGIMFSGDVVDLITIATCDTYRHMGFGTKLLEAVIKYVKQYKVDAMMLEVATTNNNAQKLYTKFGFVPIHIRKNYYFGTTDAVIMKLTL